MERSWRSGSQGFCRVLTRRDGPCALRTGTTRVDSWRAPDAPMDSRARSQSGHPSRADAKRAHGRRDHHAAHSTTSHQAASARAAVRCQRVDGTLLAHARAFCSRPCARPGATRSLSLRNGADPGNQANSSSTTSRGRRCGVCGRTRLVRRDANRPGPAAVSSAVGQASTASGSGRPAHFRRMGPR